MVVFRMYRTFFVFLKCTIQGGPKVDLLLIAYLHLLLKFWEGIDKYWIVPVRKLFYFHHWDLPINLVANREWQRWKKFCSGKRSLAEKLAANCGASRGIMPCLPLRTMYCFYFVTRLISLFLLLHISKVHLVNARIEWSMKQIPLAYKLYDATQSRIKGREARGNFYWRALMT